jgi:dipeptidyl aminopeptidase/acylaminoacyl peptidase
MTEAAEINNMIVVWPWAMNEEHTKELEYLVNECVTEVIRRYGADPTKVFAIGACAAGRDTIMLGGRSPLLYAGLAAHEVTLAGDTSEGRSDPASTPFSVVDRLKNIPVLLTHGSLDRHVSPETTILLYEKLRQPTGKTTMHIIAGADEGYYPESNNQWIWEGFAFFHIESIVKGGTAK